MKALDVAEEEFTRLMVKYPREKGISGWSWTTDEQLRNLLELDHSRPLLDFRPEPTLRGMAAPKTKREINFLRFCVNALFNRGRTAGEITAPPSHEWERPQEHARRNLLWRRMMSSVTWGSASRAVYRELVRKRCARDAEFFINGFVWGYDPRKVGNEADFRIRPFILWPAQREFAQALDRSIEEASDCYWDKSRGVGASYLPCAQIVRRWLFLDETFLVITLDEAALDNKQMDSLFGKMRDILLRLPEWMLPPGWSWAQASGCAKFANLVKPEQVGTLWKAQGPGIQGEASTGEAAVGGRWTAAFCDELPAIGKAKPGVDALLIERTRDSVRCIWAGGTPRGRAVYMARLMAGAEEDGRRHKAIRMRLTWRDDPRKRWPLFCMLVRPSDYSNQRDFYATLYKIWHLEATGQRGSAEHQAILRRCRRLDRRTEETELAKEFSPWYLDECRRRSGTLEGVEMIRSEVDGLTFDSTRYLFRKSVLEAMPVCDAAEYGDFERIRDDYRLAEFAPVGGPVAVWRKPEKDHYYVVTSDSGNAVGQDYTVIAVWDVTEWPIELAAMLRDNQRVPAGLAARYVWALLYWYGRRSLLRAFWCPEANGEGQQTIHELLCTMKFPRERVYRREKPSEDFYNIHAYGWYSSGPLRGTLIGSFKEIFEDENRPVIIRSKVMVDELGSLLAEKTTGSTYPPEEGHDDCAIAASLLVPALKGLNRVEFGEERLDVVGARLAAKQEMRKKRLEREREGRIRRHAERHEQVPIWRRE